MQNMHKLVLTSAQESELLYYEQGMIQVMPEPRLIDWMSEQGYEFAKDWFCYMPGETQGFLNPYVLSFPNEEIMSAFIIRWMSNG